MVTIVKKQREDISEKLRLIDTLNISQEQKDLLKEYVRLTNIDTIITDGDTEILCTFLPVA